MLYRHFEGWPCQEVNTAVCAHFSLSMHKLVQHCILEKWSGDDWAKKLDDKFFIVTIALCDASRLGYLSKHEAQDLRGLLLSVVYKYLNSCLGDVDELCKVSNCTSVSHVCRPSLFLRGMFARAFELPFEEFSGIACHNSGTNFVDAVVIVKNIFQAFCTGFFLLRTWISTLLQNEMLWRLFFEKLLLHGRHRFRVNMMEADFLWKLFLRDVFFEQFLVVQGQLVRSFHLLCQSSPCCSERYFSNNILRINGAEEQTSILAQEALCDVIGQVATLHKLECSNPAKICTAVLGRTLEQPPIMHQPVAGKKTFSNQMVSAEQTSSEPSDQMSCPSIRLTAGIESVEQRDKHLEFFLLSTSSKWSLKTAQELEQCASQILSAWQWDSSAPAPSYADVALAMWSACSTGKYNLAVKILLRCVKP